MYLYVMYGLRSIRLCSTCLERVGIEDVFVDDWNDAIVVELNLCSDKTRVSTRIRAASEQQHGLNAGIHGAHIAGWQRPDYCRP